MLYYSICIHFMEKYYTIPTSDGFEIKWILNSKEKSDKLIIFVHWFTGSTNESHYVWARDYFTERWFTTFRFSLYHWSNTCRKLHHSSVKDHNIDTQSVINYFSKDYKKIYLVWHSLGWPSIIWVPNLWAVHKIILWDPALEMKSSAQKIFEDNKKYYTSSGSGKNIQVSEKMLEEFKNNMLHAWKIQFFHPEKKKKMSLEAILKKDMIGFIHQLKK